MTHQCSPFHRVVHLRRMKTQRRHITGFQYGVSIYFHTKRMSCIINHLQTIFVCNLLYPNSITRFSIYMNRHYCRRFRRNRRLNFLRIDIARLRLYIHKYRFNPIPPQRMCCCHKTVRCRYHFPGNPQRLQCRNQRQCPVGEQTDIRHFQIFSQSLFQQLMVMPVIRQPFPLPNVTQAGYQFVQRR